MLHLVLETAQYWNGTKWVLLPAGEENRQLRICDGIPTWVSNSCTNLTSGLVAHYSFDDCSAKDTSESGYDGTMSNSLQCVEGINNTKGIAFAGGHDSFIETDYRH